MSALFAENLFGHQVDLFDCQLLNYSSDSYKHILTLTIVLRSELNGAY